MTKEQLQELADQIIVNWNLNLGGEPRKAFYRTWFRYLGDLDVATVQKAIDAHIIADRPFPPRAGSIRRAVFAADLLDIPTLEAAWTAATQRIHAVQQGTWVEVSPMVAKAIHEAGLTGTSRDDREAFTRAWRRVVEDLELERLALPEDA